jgi:hypothetical protein
MLAIADKRIERKDAGMLLYSLQQAASNIIGSGCTYGGLADVTDEHDRIPVKAYPGFEEDYQLPPDLDMTIDPNDDLSGNEPDHVPPPKPVASALSLPSRDESVA